jgi:hypothetical protein
MINYSIYFCYQDMILSTMEMLKWMIIVRISGHCCLLNGWIILSSSTFIFHHHWVTVDCFYLFISYLYFILKVMFNQCFISFINSGLFYKWGQPVDLKAKTRPGSESDIWQPWNHHCQPFLFRFVTNFPRRCDGHVGDRSSSWFENAAFCCMFVVIWQPTLSSELSSDSGLPNKLSVVWGFHLPSPFSKWQVLHF